MAAGAFLAATPSAVTVAANVVDGITGVDFQEDATNASVHTDDLKYPFDGGNVMAEAPRVTLRTKGTKDQAGTPNVLTTVFIPGEDPGQIVITQDGRGAETQDRTATIAHPRVAGTSQGDAEGRSEMTVELECYSVDGATRPVVYAWA